MSDSTAGRPLNHCRSKGTLGPVRYRVPASPTRFRFAGDQEVTLCSAIVCAACRAPVRWFDGGQLGEGQDARQLVYSNGLQPIEGFDPRSCPSRLYVCPCTSHSCGAQEYLSTAADYPESGLPPSWSCGGHPVLAEPPLEFEGRPVGANPDWATLIEALFRSPPAPGEPAHARINWLCQVRGLLTGTPAAEAIDEVLRSLLASPDARLRGHTIIYLWNPAEGDLAAMLPQLLLRDAEALRRQSDSFFPYPDLYDVTVRAVAAHSYYGLTPRFELFQTTFREHALTPHRLEGVGWMLAVRDRAWFLAHFDELVAASPETAVQAAKWKRQAGG